MATSTPFLLLVLHLCSGSLGQPPEDLTISTLNGKVRGTRLSVLGHDVRAFLGVPYAKPPLGELRFRAPKPAGKWEGVKNAANFSNTCYQLPDTLFPEFSGAEMWNPNTPVSEDCLYLNVWTPHLKGKSQTLPVLVWIYGGGFTSGTSSLALYDGRFLSQSENVVVVSMNYRLGALGFLSLPENDNIRGNAGLLDQQLALRWVADNIAFFGGDSSKVTLFGESAGAASVGFHLLAPSSHGLFHRAILQSGVPTAPWASLSQRETWKSLSLASLLGCPRSPAADLERCLQRVDLVDIVTEQFQVLTEASILGFPFAPSADGLFLPDEPEVCVGTFVYSEHGGKAFFYLFDHRSSANPWPAWMGVMHGYEIEFVFGMPLNASLKYTEREVNMSRSIMKQWANFARTGNPSNSGVPWPLFQAESQFYLTLNTNQPLQRSKMIAQQCQFWTNLVPKIQGVSGMESHKHQIPLPLFSMLSYRASHEYGC
uniref:Carboxylic ester hydrolase n=1 Tax=Gadus morhua TaxID=8049 RepID=A0A8C5BMZ2_GADMO